MLFAWKVDEQMKNLGGTPLNFDNQGTRKEMEKRFGEPNSKPRCCLNGLRCPIKNGRTLRVS